MKRTMINSDISVMLDILLFKLEEIQDQLDLIVEQLAFIENKLDTENQAQEIFIGEEEA